MSTTTRKRGARFYVEFDPETTEAVDAHRKTVGLSRMNFLRWIVARQVHGTASLNAVAMEKAR